MRHLKARTETSQLKSDIRKNNLGLALATLACTLGLTGVLAAATEGLKAHTTQSAIKHARTSNAQHAAFEQRLAELQPASPQDQSKPRIELLLTDDERRPSVAALTHERNDAASLANVLAWPAGWLLALGASGAVAGLRRKQRYDIRLESHDVRYGTAFARPGTPYRRFRQTLQPQPVHTVSPNTGLAQAHNTILESETRQAQTLRLPVIVVDAAA